MPTSITGSGPGVKSPGVLRDLLSSVAQQVESHLHPSLALSPLGSRHGQIEPRPSRIRSWIAYDKDKDKDKDKEDGDNSLHFTDTSDDDFQFADAISTQKKDKKKHRNEVQAFSDPNANANQNEGLIQRAKHPKQDDDNDATMHMLPDEIREEETVDMLTGLMGEGFDREVTRRILRKYDGNVDKAAGALVEGERGEELIGHAPGPGQSQSQGWPAIQGAGSSASGWPAARPTQTQTPSTQTSGCVGRPSTPVIDLTLDDDPDLQRAMQESMNMHSGAQSQMQIYAPSYTQAQSLSQVYAPSQDQDQAPNHMQGQSQPERPVFGPSERPPDPNWAIVPSHVRCFLWRFGVALLTIGSHIAKREQRCELSAELESCYRGELGNDGGLGCARAVPR